MKSILLALLEHASTQETALKILEARVKALQDLSNSYHTERVEELKRLRDEATVALKSVPSELSSPEDALSPLEEIRQSILSLPD